MCSHKINNTLGVIRGMFFSTIFIILFIPPATAVQQTSMNNLGTNHKVHAELFMPDGQGPFPGVLVLHTVGGLKKNDLQYARQLASEGYACLVPEYLKPNGSFISGKLSKTEYADTIHDDFRSELQYMKANPKIIKDKIGAVGFSLGGFWALVLAGCGEVQAGVSYYGALIDNGAYQFRDCFTKYSSPVLILHGTADGVIPVRYVESLKTILDERGSPYEIKLYPGAQHRFERMKKSDPAVIKDSWDKTTSFLSKYLR